MKKYVALLRGINVGGHKKVPMKDLKDVFEKNDYENVKTFLASGNVVFEGKDGKDLKISEILEKAFGFEIKTIVLPFEDVEKLVKANPFKDIAVTPETRLYVTFLSDESKGNIDVPYTSEDQSFRILKKFENILLSVLDLSKTGRPDAMDVLEKTFGKTITTRNYNTIKRIVGAK